MVNCIICYIFNVVICCNLFFGCIVSVMVFNENYILVIFFIILGVVFDFFDGMLVCLFKVLGFLGKELDLLVDDIIFGFVFFVIVFFLFKEVYYFDFLLFVVDYMFYIVFFIFVFLVLCLGKFNIDLC